MQWVRGRGVNSAMDTMGSTIHTQNQHQYVCVVCQRKASGQVFQDAEDEYNEMQEINSEHRRIYIPEDEICVRAEVQSSLLIQEYVITSCAEAI